MKPAYPMPNAALADWGRNAAFGLQKCPGWKTQDQSACASSTMPPQVVSDFGLRRQAERDAALAAPIAGVAQAPSPLRSAGALHKRGVDLSAPTTWGCTASSVKAFLLREGCAPLARVFLARPELALFVLLLALFNWPVLRGSAWHSMIFLPAAVGAGEWWRLITHPFVHVSWYHLLLDGAAFLMLYQSLAEQSLVRRLTYVLAVGAGSLLISWWFAPGILMNGLCGLSGIAHGLMAVSALEMAGVGDQQSSQSRVGWATLFLVTSKSALEALTGTAFFSFLHFGLMGTPVAVSHAGGVLGGLCAWLLIHAMPPNGSKGQDIKEADSMPLKRINARYSLTQNYFLENLKGRGLL